MCCKKIIILVVLLTCLVGCSKKVSYTEENKTLAENQLVDEASSLEKDVKVIDEENHNQDEEEVAVLDEPSEILKQDLENDKKSDGASDLLDKNESDNGKQEDPNKKQQESVVIQDITEKASKTESQEENTPVPVPVKVKEEKAQHSVKLSISCSTILNNKEQFNSEKLELLPADGMILAMEKMTYKEGETVFDVLVRATKDSKIHMEYTGSSVYNTNYIEGINNIYEFDCGPLSGWMYKVNGIFPNYGCSNYKLKDGDVIEWVYTCDLGKDVGGGEMFREGGQ